MVGGSRFKSVEESIKNLAAGLEATAVKTAQLAAFNASVQAFPNQQSHKTEGAANVEPFMFHSLSMAFECENYEESVTLMAKWRNGSKVTKVFDENPNPILVDKIEAKGAGKDSEEQNDIGIKDKSSLHELSEIQDAESDDTGLVFNEWPESEFMKEIDNDVFSSRDSMGKIPQGFFPLLAEHSIMRNLDYSDYFWKLESNHIIDKASVVFCEYRKVKNVMVEAGRFVTTENQWCNDFKIRKG